MTPRVTDQALDLARYAEMQADPQKAIKLLAEAVRILAAELRRLNEEREDGQAHNIDAQSRG